MREDVSGSDVHAFASSLVRSLFMIWGFLFRFLKNRMILYRSICFPMLVVRHCTILGYPIKIFMFVKQNRSDALGSNTFEV